MKKQVRNVGLVVSSMLGLVAVAVVSAPVDARPVAVRRSGSKDDWASLLDTSRTKPLDAAENKILPRGGTDFLDMAGKALEDAGSTLRVPPAATIGSNAGPSSAPMIDHAWLWDQIRGKHSATPLLKSDRFGPAPPLAPISHTPTVTAEQQPARAPDAMDSSLHLSDLLSGSPHAPLHDGASSSSSAVPPLQSPAKLTDAQPKEIPPELLRHIRTNEEREQLLSDDTRQLIRKRLYARERRATRANWAAPAVLTPKQQSLRDSSLATVQDREDFDSKDSERFWLAYHRVNKREREAKIVSPEERAAFVAKLASGNTRRRSGELTENQKALQRSEFFKPRDRSELDLNYPERSRKVWSRVRARKKSAEQVSQKQQAAESNRRDEAPKNLIDAQRASTLALTSTGFEAPPRVSQAPKSSKAVRIESPQHSTGSDSDIASFAHLLEQGLLGSPEHSAQSNVHTALPDSERTRHSSHSPPSPGEEEVQRAWHIPFDWEVR